MHGCGVDRLAVRTLPRLLAAHEAMNTGGIAGVEADKACYDPGPNSSRGLSFSFYVLLLTPTTLFHPVSTAQFRLLVSLPTALPIYMYRLVSYLSFHTVDILSAPFYLIVCTIAP